MKIFAIGDLHLSLDERIEKPMDIFGSRWANHHNRIKEHWEELVGPNDVVVIPGDISWGLRENEALADLEWISKLPGRKILTKGNHDLWWTSVSRLNKLHENMTFLQNKCIMVSDKVAICGSRGWFYDAQTGLDKKVIAREASRIDRSIEEGKKLGGELIVFLHYPPLSQEQKCDEIMQVLIKHGIERCFYGHLHGGSCLYAVQEKVDGIEFFLVSADFLQFCPRILEKF